MKYLHTMVRVSNIDESLDFYCNKLGLEEIRRYESEQGRFTLVFLAAQLGRRALDLSECRAFIGGRGQADLLCLDDFARLGIAVQTTTDDGSAGDQCLVTHPVEAALARTPPDLIVDTLAKVNIQTLIALLGSY